MFLLYHYYRVGGPPKECSKLVSNGDECGCYMGYG